MLARARRVVVRSLGDNMMGERVGKSVASAVGKSSGGVALVLYFF